MFLSYVVETKSILSYSSFLFCICYPNIVLHLPCVSRWVCDAALWQQTLVTAAEVWETQLTLGASTSSTAFTYSLRCHVKRRGRVAHLFHSIQHLLDCLFYMLCYMRPTKPVRIHTRCNSRVKSVGCNAEMVRHTRDSKTPGDKEKPGPLPRSWLSRAIHSITFSGPFLATSLSRGFSLSFWEYLQVFVALVSLPVLLKWTRAL